MPRRMTPKLLKDYADQSWTYEAFCPDGRLHIVCPHCRALILLFEDLSAEAKREIAVMDGKDLNGAWEKLRDASGCDLRQAKAIIHHIRDAESRCHNCQSTVPPGSLLCAQCMAVNLDW
jgi:thiol-disulfide isomerase/thioredoxin